MDVIQDFEGIKTWDELQKSSRILYKRRINARVVVQVVQEVFFQTEYSQNYYPMPLVNFFGGMEWQF